MDKPGLIVPYRDRASHLRQFVPRYQSIGNIYIIEQEAGKPFNRAKLLNVGYQLFKDQFDYFATHDVDMMLSKGDYSRPTCPTHLATRCSQFRYRLPYPTYFGGVVLFTNKDFEALNGYSNRFWGYGGEDDEMYDHVLKSGFKIERRQCTYESLHHARNIDPVLHKANVELWEKGRQPGDGLTECDYQILNVYDHANYKKVSVRI